MSWQLTRQSVWPNIYADSADAHDDDDDYDSEQHDDVNENEDDAADDGYVLQAEVVRDS